MDILIKRIWKTDSYSGGKCYINGKEFSFTIEDPDRGLKQSMDLNEILKIKKKAITAIPIGKYEIVFTYSNRFKRYMPLIMNVKGFDGTRIHVANKAVDVEGCIGLAYEDSSDGFAGNSDKACKDFERILRNVEKTEKIWLTIE